MSENSKFKVGDGVSMNINSDSYPGTVRKVSASGKTVWVSHDIFEGTPGANTHAEYDKKGTFTPVDVSEEHWEKYTLRQNGKWRPVGAKNYGSLTLGRSYRQDPHF